jgi:hypothetical protein
MFDSLAAGEGRKMEGILKRLWTWFLECCRLEINDIQESDGVRAWTRNFKCEGSEGEPRGTECKQRSRGSPTCIVFILDFAQTQVTWLSWGWGGDI